MKADHSPIESNSAPTLARYREPNPSTLGSAPSPEEPRVKDIRKQRITVTIAVFAIIILLALVIGAVFLLLQPGTPTGKIRDIFIIFMALESLLIGLTLVILLIQLSRLINLLQNEVKPILDSTNETANTLRGTVTFLSDNLVEPIVKLNEYLATLNQLRDILSFTRRK